MTIQFLELAGKRFVVLPEEDYRRMSGDELPGVPSAADGSSNAVAYGRYSIAKSIIEARKRAGLSQAELARRAKVRVEVLNRIERAKVTAEHSTIQKITKALHAAGQDI